MLQYQVAIGGIWHETNTFATGLTTLDDFKAYQFARQFELIERYKTTNTELGGVIRAAEQIGIQLVPTLFAAAVPSGIIEKRSLDCLLDEIAASIRDALPLDGVILALHGAAVAETIDDVDGYTIERVRQVVGPAIPIVATFDYHANLSDGMVHHASVLIGYDTYPHTDMARCGAEACHVIVDLISNNRDLYRTHRKLPLLTSPLKQSTSESPMLEVMQTLHQIESAADITCGSIAMGFPYSDVAHLGASVVMYGTNPKSVESAATTVAREIWSSRHEFHEDILPVSECVKRAMNSTEFPVVIVEPADNVGGGSAGDGTGVLAELLKRQAKKSVVVVYDPAAVIAAEQAGVGQLCKLWIGGKTDNQHGAPVETNALIRSITTGEYEHKGSYMTGYITSMGRTALVEACGVQIVLTSRRSMPFDAEQLRCLGIKPEEQKVIVVKAAVAWKAAFGEIAKRALVTDTPGVCAAELARLNYRNRSRPIFPLEQHTTYLI